ncbi:hypothetical protein CPB86DRAFT_115443 [Serendipita vermifera]|nr:hypothetical protein CPB86DRAFT_115443 [Serendipita vermifera]
MGYYSLLFADPRRFLDSHSSSSAIFERDIEPLGVPSLSVPLQTAAIASSSSQHGRSATTATSTANAHRIPRSKTTEAIEMTVPSVLDSAVSALTIAEETGTNITVLSPVPTQGAHPLVQHSTSNLQSPLSAHSQSSPITSTFTQPNLAAPGGVGSIGSTSGTSGGSPSPPTMSLLLQGMGMSGLMSASASVSGAASASGFASGFASPLSSSRAPSPARSVSPPVHNNISEITPSITSGSPRSTTKEAPNVGSSPLKRPSLPPPGLGSNQNMPSPNMRASNRLSFISYTDLLTSAPIASQPLSAVLSPGQNEPPTHLVVVDADNAPSVVGSGTNASSSHLPLGIGSLNVSNPSDKVDVDSLGTVGLSSAGEWGREGMGGGLEERLERLWAAEKEINERGRVMKPNGSTSRSASIGVSIDTSQPAPSATT